MQDAELENWYQSVQFFTHMGHQVAYRDNGRKAQALVLFHGFPNSSWDWHRLWPLLDQHYRLVTLDFLGYGLSDKPLDHDYSVIDQADQVSRLLRFLGVERTHLLSHSSGISVTQELLALKELDQDPDLPELGSVVFLNGSVLPGSAPTIMEQRLLQTQGEDITQNIDATFLHNIMNSLAGSSHGFTLAETERAWYQIERNGGVSVMPKLLRYVEERKAFYERWELAMCATQVPLAVMLGGEDPVWGKSLLDDVHEQMPRIHTKLFRDAGHYPYLHAVEALAAAVLAFNGHGD